MADRDILQHSSASDGLVARSLFGEWLRAGLFLVAFFVAVVMPTVLVLRQQDQEAWLLILAGATGMILLRLDDIKSFALGPLKAELATRIAQARQITEHANATVLQLQELAAAVAPMLLNTLITPRFSHGPSVEQYTGKDKIVAQLRALCVPEERLREALKKWLIGAEMDHQDAIEAAMKRSLPVSDNRNTILSEMSAPLLENRHTVARGDAVPADQYIGLAQQFGALSEDVDNAISDLRYFQAHQKLRRPDVFPGRPKSLE